MKGEFELINEIRRRFPVPEGLTGIGDDCAAIPQKPGRETLVTTDMLVQGVHFLVDDIGAYQLGWKAAASNFSDIAAMGGTPLGFFLALSLPADVKDSWIRDFLTGLRDISKRYGFPLLGGDTTSSKGGIVISITALGEAPEGKSVKRSGAKIADCVCVTGTLGDSAAGLDAILSGARRTSAVEILVQRHYHPVPRIEEGMALALSGCVHSMMDISDGIGSDLRHIMEESGVGMEIDLSKLPISRELRTYSALSGKDIYGFAADGGEDYELLFTLAPEDEASLTCVPHSVIGTVTDTKKLVWIGSDKDYKGFRHF